MCDSWIFLEVFIVVCLLEACTALARGVVCLAPYGAST